MRPFVPPAMALLGLTLGTSACISQDLYGVAISDSALTDADGDGYSRLEGDCDDEDATIHPEAEESPGDGIDSNCNGEDDT
jgi:hypothetical protein